MNRIVSSAAGIGIHMALERTECAATFFAGQAVTLKQRIREAQNSENAIERESGTRRQAQRKAGALYEFEFGGGDPDPELRPC